MVSGVKQQWGELRKGCPGHRFQDRYERSRNAQSGNALQQLLPFVVGAVLIGAGLVFCVIPGPGVPLILVGAALLAERSLFMARALDWVEVKLRALFRQGVAWWRHASKVARHAIILFAIFAIAGAGYGAYYVVFGR
jgi:hypothetical protein